MVSHMITDAGMPAEDSRAPSKFRPTGKLLRRDRARVSGADGPHILRRGAPGGRGQQGLTFDFIEALAACDLLWAGHVTLSSL